MNSIAKKTFSHYQIKTNQITLSDFNKLPSWHWISNKEVKISSTEIRQKREILREQKLKAAYSQKLLQEEG